MSHSNTQRLTDYWRERRGEALAPARASVDPSDFIDLLPQVFMLGRLAPGRYAMRLSGDFLKRLYERDLRQADFLALWTGADRARLQTQMEAALRRGDALLLDALARSIDGQAGEFEILLAPLTSASGRLDRFLGLYQPITPLAGLIGHPVDRLRIRQLRILPAGRHAAPARPPALRLAALNGNLV